MKITPAPLKISQFFSGGGQQFLIPAYQRRYSWKNKQLVELFNDIDLLDKDDNHLLGTILCLSEAYVHGINTLELVDGQQRITSLMIFLKAIQERYIELDKKRLAEKINNFLYCEGIDGKRQNKVVLGDLDGPDYKMLMGQRNLELIKNPNLINAYEYFQKRLKDYNLEKLNRLYFKLINNVIIISLDVSEAKDAYKLFETINNRGLKLSATDIIKNFLLGYASTIKSKQNEDILKDVRDNWKELIINLDGINTDDFFRQYMSGILKRKIPKSKLIDEFRRYYVLRVKNADKIPEYQFYRESRIKNNGNNRFEKAIDKRLYDKTKTLIEIKKNSNKVSIVIFSQLLKEASSVYSKLLSKSFENKKVNRHLFNLERIKSVPSYIFLLNLFQRKLDDNSKIAILKLLETFMLRRNICQYRTGELDDIFSSLVEVSNEDIVNEVKKRLLKHLPSDEEFKAKLLSHDFNSNRGRNRAKYILEEIEYDLIRDEGEYVLSSDLEHIIPQTINTKKSKREFGDWVKYLGKDALGRHKRYVCRIGNLTLLGTKLNIIASNNPFRSKLSEYKKSNIAMTKKIVEEFKEFRFYEVGKRSEELIRKAIKIWQFD